MTRCNLPSLATKGCQYGPQTCCGLWGRKWSLWGKSRHSRRLFLPSPGSHVHARRLAFARRRCVALSALVAALPCLAQDSFSVRNVTKQGNQRNGAGDRDRTGDIQLGKLAFYR